MLQTVRFHQLHCPRGRSLLSGTAAARQVTELESAIARMEAEADELVASRTPLEAQRQQLIKCGNFVH